MTFSISTELEPLVRNQESYKLAKMPSQSFVAATPNTPVPSSPLTSRSAIIASGDADTIHQYYSAVISESTVGLIAAFLPSLNDDVRATIGFSGDWVTRDFTRLKKEWKTAVEFSSSMTEILSHRAYLKIIALGPVVVPLIFKELKEEPDYWFLALETLTGQNPVPKTQIGDLKAMTKAWLSWGQEHGFID